MPTVQRKIYFYRWQQIRQLDEAQVFDPATAANLIADLPFAGRERYLELEDGNDVCVWPSQLPTGRVVMQVGVVRRYGLPQLEEDGTVSALALTERQGLLESTHAVFFPNGIVGAEFNFFGPRLSRLSGYMQEKLGLQIPFIKFNGCGSFRGTCERRFFSSK